MIKVNDKPHLAVCNGGAAAQLKRSDAREPRPHSHNYVIGPYPGSRKKNNSGQGEVTV